MNLEPMSVTHETNLGKFTVEQLCDLWRKRINEHRDSQASNQRHRMPDLAKWHEGQADALERAESELKYLTPAVVPAADVEPLIASVCDMITDNRGETRNKVRDALATFRSKHPKPESKP